MIRPFGLLVCAAILVSCGDAKDANVGSASESTVQTPAAMPSGVVLEQTVSPQGDDIVIPYKKFVYPNGLTVLLHEDDSDPLVHVNITYHVGSAREEAQRSGFAHFFEHMMFQGSAHVADEEHFQIVTEVGGTLNGSTSNDRTNYFQTVPANHLETTLWLEADRMGFLLEAVTQEKFEVQRSTVKNERGQNVDNRPYGLVYEKLVSALYPSGHAYSWPVIGYPEDLDAATLEDLKHFFLRWYGPNNATLIVAGNVDEMATLALIDKYFGSIPRGPGVERALASEVALDADRYVSYVDQNIRFPLLVMSYPTVHYGDPDRIPLEALASILGGGKNSPFYQEFVLSNRAIDASASHESLELSGFFVLEAQTYQGASLEEFESDIRELLSSFSLDDISDDALEMFKGSTEANLINGLESVRGKASRLAMYDYLIDNPNYLPQEIAQLRSLSKEDVYRVFEKYLRDEPAVVLSVLSKEEPDAVAAQDNFTPAVAMRVVDSTLDDLEPRPVADTFDRSTRPVSGAAPLVDVPPFWRTELSNGAKIIGSVSTEVPTVAISLEFLGGHLLNDQENYGLAQLTAAMMNEGTTSLSAEEFETALEKLGSQIRVGASRDRMNVDVRALSRNLVPTLALLEQRLLQSEFTQENLDRLRRQQLESLEASREQPRAIADEVYGKLLYGFDNPLAIPLSGLSETVEAISLEDIKEFASRSMSSQALEMVVVGDVEQDTIMANIGFLDGMSVDAIPMALVEANGTASANTLYLVDKPGAAQSEIRVGYLTQMPYDATGEYFKSSLMNYVLGGAFNSRINLNLREDKGYTYGARSGFSSTKIPGPFTASSSVRRDASAASVNEFMKEIQMFADDGISLTELAFMRAAVGQRDALNYETPRQKAAFLAGVLEYDLAADFVERQSEIIQSISKDEIDTLATQLLPYGDMFILVVGDKAEITDSIAELGYPVVELGSDGVVIE